MEHANDGANANGHSPGSVGSAVSQIESTSSIILHEEVAPSSPPTRKFGDLLGILSDSAAATGAARLSMRQ